MDLTTVSKRSRCSSRAGDGSSHSHVAIQDCEYVKIGKRERIGRGEIMAKFENDGADESSPVRLARTLLALGDPVRLRMLNLMLWRPVTPKQLSRVFSIGLREVSKHLTCLDEGGVVAGLRRNRIKHYVLRKRSTDLESRLLRLSLAAIRFQPRMRADVSMLNLVCKLERRGKRREGGQAPEPSEGKKASSIRRDPSSITSPLTTSRVSAVPRKRTRQASTIVSLDSASQNAHEISSSL
jgi:DNA-binding transcriptional ArsR family regulator